MTSDRKYRLRNHIPKHRKYVDELYNSFKYYLKSKPPLKLVQVLLGYLYKTKINAYVIIFFLNKTIA